MIVFFISLKSAKASNEYSSKVLLFTLINGLGTLVLSLFPCPAARIIRNSLKIEPYLFNGFFYIMNNSTSYVLTNYFIVFSFYEKFTQFRNIAFIVAI